MSALTTTLKPMPLPGTAALPRPSQSPQCIGQRFTLDGDAALEEHLAKTCASVASGVGRTVPKALLQGLLLAGGYGRGEGGVLSGPQGDMPYNDMEFYVFLSGSSLINDRLFKRALHHLGEHLSEEAGIEVEFKILSLKKLRRTAVSMFTYDFIMGHRWLIGGDHLLTGCEHHYQAATIPVHEATRLLFNRCTGLLFARERLERDSFNAEDASFVTRNIAKVQLALGDAVLASKGRYHWSCLERSRRLSREADDVTPWMAAVKKHHEAGVSFKLHPRNPVSSKSELLREWQEISELAAIIWLELESQRLGSHFDTVSTYALSSQNKCPEQPALRNLLVNLRHAGPRTLFRRQALRYPRETLMHVLALLLWADLSDPAILNAVQQDLRSSQTGFSKLVGCYQQLYTRIN